MKRDSASNRTTTAPKKRRTNAQANRRSAKAARRVCKPLCRRYHGCACPVESTAGSTIEKARFSQSESADTNVVATTIQYAELSNEASGLYDHVSAVGVKIKQAETQTDCVHLSVSPEKCNDTDATSRTSPEMSHPPIASNAHQGEARTAIACIAGTTRLLHPHEIEHIATRQQLICSNNASLSAVKTENSGSNVEQGFAREVVAHAGHCGSAQEERHPIATQQKEIVLAQGQADLKKSESFAL